MGASRETMSKGMPKEKDGAWDIVPEGGMEFPVLGECMGYWYVQWDNGSKDGFILKGEKHTTTLDIFPESPEYGFIFPEDNARINLWRGESLQLTWRLHPDYSFYKVRITCILATSNIEIYYSENPLTPTSIELNEFGTILSENNMKNTQLIPRDQAVWTVIDLLGSKDGIVYIPIDERLICILPTGGIIMPEDGATIEMWDDEEIKIRWKNEQPEIHFYDYSIHCEWRTEDHRLKNKQLYFGYVIPDDKEYIEVTIPIEKMNAEGIPTDRELHAWVVVNGLT